MANKRGQQKFVEHKGVAYQVGDDVLLLNDADPDAPFICKIEQVVTRNKVAGMRVKWYYRPEETCSGRRELRSRTKKDFYSRFTYLASTETFQPDQIAVYCKCQMPFNPDKHMVECPGCQSWYHPECLGYQNREEFREKFYSKPDGKFVCEECQKVSASPPASLDEDHDTSETIRF